MEDWSRITKNGLNFWICNPLLEHCGTEALFTTRSGGASIGPWYALNLSLKTGDYAAHVNANLQALMTSLAIDPQVVRGTQQIHGVDIVNPGPDSYPTVSPGADGIFDREGRHVLVTLHADCAPVYLAAAGNQALLLLHAGWRGTAAGITRRGVELFTREANCSAKDLFAAIGPCIHECCYEVGTEVARAFADFLGERCGEAMKVVPATENKYRLNLARANRIILEQSGVLPEHIYENRLCTACHEADFFSHRRDEGQTGRMMAILRRTEVSVQEEGRSLL